MRKPLRREARKHLPSDPQSLDGYRFPGILRTSLDDAKFFQKDVTVENVRLLIWAWDASLRILLNGQTWHSDGTFYVVPHQFH